MSLFSQLREAALAEKPPTREVVILEADPGMQAPELKAEIAHGDLDDWAIMSRDYRPRGAEVTDRILWVQTITSDKRQKLVGAFLKKYLRNLIGLCRENMLRISRRAVDNPQIVGTLPEGIIPFEPDMVADLAVLMDFNTFLAIWLEVTNLPEFGKAIQAKNA